MTVLALRGLQVLPLPFVHRHRPTRVLRRRLLPRHHPLLAPLACGLPRASSIPLSPLISRTPPLRPRQRKLRAPRWQAPLPKQTVSHRPATSAPTGRIANASGRLRQRRHFHIHRLPSPNNHSSSNQRPPPRRTRSQRPPSRPPRDFSRSTPIRAPRSAKLSFDVTADASTSYRAASLRRRRQGSCTSCESLFVAPRSEAGALSRAWCTVRRVRYSPACALAGSGVALPGSCPSLIPAMIRLTGQSLFSNPDHTEEFQGLIDTSFSSFSCLPKCQPEGSLTICHRCDLLRRCSRPGRRKWVLDVIRKEFEC
jgi:hypothetical protein